MSPYDVVLVRQSSGDLFEDGQTDTGDRDDYSNPDIYSCGVRQDVWLDIQWYYRRVDLEDEDVEYVCPFMSCADN
jgi:hypothetical protein